MGPAAVRALHRGAQRAVLRPRRAGRAAGARGPGGRPRLRHGRADRVARRPVAAVRADRARLVGGDAGRGRAARPRATALRGGRSGRPAARGPVRRDRLQRRAAVGARPRRGARPLDRAAGARRAAGGAGAGQRRPPRPRRRRRGGARGPVLRRAGRRRPARHRPHGRRARDLRRPCSTSSASAGSTSACRSTATTSRPPRTWSSGRRAPA